MEFFPTLLKRLVAAAYLVLFSPYCPFPLLYFNYISRADLYDPSIYSVGLLFANAVHLREVFDRNSTAYSIHRSVYIIHENVRHKFPDRYTMQSYGYHWNSNSRPIVPMPDPMISSTKEGEPITTMWDNHPNKKLLETLKGRESLVEQLEFCLPFLNPAIIYRRTKRDWLVSWRLSDSMFRIVHIHATNRSSLSQNMSDVAFWFHNYSSSLATEHPQVPFIDLRGEDPRLFEMSDGKTFAVYARRYPRKTPELKMSYTELMIGNGTITLDDIVDVTMESNLERHHDQKNWMPFEWDNRLHFISSISPHRIVRVVRDPKKSWIGMGKVVAVSDFPVGFQWDYGPLRGGTQAVQISQDRFMTIFHSSVDPPDTGDVLKTYVMGAYTFSAESGKQFRIESITTEPIVHESFYNGEWTNLPRSYSHIDYIVFPMSLMVEEGFLYVSFGKQDRDGYMLKMGLGGLLRSMKSLD